MRIMGLDFGGMTCGVAISDELLITAQPVTTIRRKHETKLRQTFSAIEELCLQYEVGKIVVGLPKKLDDTDSERTVRCREFAENVARRTGKEVILWDERLTTVEAERILDEAGLSYKEKGQVVDKIAAAIILQSYLDSRETKRS
ncbi:MAG: Holliday junction resolvase RuvX [Lachnospiraceae bacterium]|nr:Holliday junction resolvase RuvX [Lachnospiraceae bacterium]